MLFREAWKRDLHFVDIVGTTGGISYFPETRFIESRTEGVLAAYIRVPRYQQHAYPPIVCDRAVAPKLQDRVGRTSRIGSGDFFGSRGDGAGCIVSEARDMNNQ